MNKFRFAINILAIAIFMFAFASLAQAQAAHTWVSGVGDDANPCSRTAPCKTWAGTISKTAAFGTMQCLDPGGFGSVTIVKSMTILCEEHIGFIQATGVNAIIVNLPLATDRVTVRGLTIDGTGTGIDGIRFIGAGTLSVQEVTIRGMAQNGINFAPSSGTAHLQVSSGTVITNNNGGNINFAGILIKPTGGASANVSIDGVQLENNTNGVVGDGSGGGGISNINVRSSRISGNSNTGVVVNSSGASFSAIVDSTLLTYNVSTGAAVAGASGTLRLGNCTISNNVTGVANFGGTLQSFKNNLFAGNSTDGTPITAVPGGTGN